MKQGAAAPEKDIEMTDLEMKNASHHAIICPHDVYDGNDVFYTIWEYIACRSKEDMMERADRCEKAGEDYLCIHADPFVKTTMLMRMSDAEKYRTQND